MILTGITCEAAEMKKIILIVVDGMRPDGMISCGHPLIGQLKKHSFYTFRGRTVFPSVTLPCHLSLFHSVPPEIHGTIDNKFVLPPLPGAGEVMKKQGKEVMFFYNWAELRDLARPDSLKRSVLISSHDYGGKAAAQMITDEVIRVLKKEQPDFIFLHLDQPDGVGHEHYWMTEEYLQALRDCFDCIGRIIPVLPEDYLLVLLSDHGGHRGRHGTELPEDMTIPVFFYHSSLVSRELPGANIIDVMPTALVATGMEPDRAWQGKVLFQTINHKEKEK